MAIIGIAIQSRTGIPLFVHSWSDRLSAFRDGNPILIAGFLSAMSSFASNFKQEFSYIRFHPTDFPEDTFGIDGVYSFIGEYMILVFSDPYQFHEMINYKIEWIYGKILSRYEEMLRIGRVPEIADEERLFIENVLMDTVAWDIIFTQKEQLNVVAEQLVRDEFPEDVYGCFVTSFDNTILYSYGMEREETEIYLNNIASRGHGIEDGEVVHNYVSLPGLEPKLVVMTNPGVKIQISDILQDGLVGQGGVPFYYYAITDVNCAIGPIIESLTEKFNSVLL